MDLPDLGIILVVVAGLVFPIVGGIISVSEIGKPTPPPKEKYYNLRSDASQKTKEDFIKGETLATDKECFSPEKEEIKGP